MTLEGRIPFISLQHKISPIDNDYVKGYQAPSPSELTLAASEHEITANADNGSVPHGKQHPTTHA